MVIDAKVIFLLRCILAAIWLYNGLWLKVIVHNAHHLAIVSPIAPSIGLSALAMLQLIGSCETLLAFGILSGLFHRFVSYFQIGVIILMNIIGIVFGGGAIADPLGLIISNLPTLACAWLVALYGPGAYSLNGTKNQ